MCAKIKTLFLTFFIAGLSLSATSLWAQGTMLLRSPDIHNDRVVFNYGGDVWIANTDGRALKRLTSFGGVERMPRFSPDGQTIAFTAEYEGNTDVYTVPATGGTPKRLTWHPRPDIATGWDPKGEAVMFASGRAMPPYLVPNQLWLVQANGGTPTPFILPRAKTGKYSPDGKQFVYERILPIESEFRNYRGGQINPIRIFDLATYETTELPWKNSQDVDPVWVGNLIYFFSDRDFAMNLWEYNTQSKALKQVTFFSEFDCKQLESDGKKLIFENGGYLYTYEPGQAKPKKLSIQVDGDFPEARPYWAKAQKNLLAAYPSPTGQRVAIAARGEVLTVPVDKGSPRNLTNSPVAADRDVAWSPDGQSICWFSDQSGEYALIVADQYGKNQQSFTFENPTFYYKPVWSPDSKYICFYDEGRTLYYLNVATGKRVTIDNEGSSAHPQQIIYGSWSPDSKWIAYTKRLDNEFGTIFIYSLAQNKKFQITDGMADCKSPTWDRDGKYLYFSASTNHGLNVSWLDMTSYDRPTDRSIYALALAKGTPSPVLPESDEEPEKKKEAPEAKSSKGKKGKKGSKSDAQESDSNTVKIDFDGLSLRIVALPIPAKNYIDLQAADGALLYTEMKSQGSPLTLYRYNFEDREHKKVADKISGFQVAADGKNFLHYSRGGKLYLTSTMATPDLSGDLINLSGVNVKVVPALEWKQMFREAWRFQRDYFYVDNVHGLDLDWVYKTYSPMVDFVKHRDDLNYLLDILGGETAVGHSFVFGGEMPKIDQVAIGMLGADYETSQGKFRIKKIYSGESWNPKTKAPLSVPGLDVKVGDYLLAVNGMPLNATDNLFSFFTQTVGVQTSITVNSQPNMSGARTITVVPIRSELSLRQIDWVEGNRRKVNELSGGKLAYVWLPNTGRGGYNSFNRYYFAQQDKQGVIIDERFNRGGSVADYIIDLLARKQVGYFNNAVGNRKPFTTPNGNIWGPKVMLINEMAGSGGDILPFMFKHNKIGPLVGTTTWGGLVGIWDVPELIDGGAITAPRGGFFNMDGEWDVENIGVKPDIEVEQTDKLVIEGRDPQLEKAVEVALEALKDYTPPLDKQPKDPIRSIRPKARD